MPPFSRQGFDPLYPAILWNRPVARNAGGRLLIIGGHRGDFSLPTALHGLALAAGIGQVTVVLPDALRSLLAGVPDVVFVPSSQAGSLGRLALGEILELAERHDGLLFANPSNNSETVTLIETLIQKCKLPIILPGESLETLGHQLSSLISLPNLLILTSWAQFIKLANGLGKSTNLQRSDLSGKLSIVKMTGESSRCSYMIMGPELIVSSGTTITVTDAPGAVANPAVCLAVTSVFWTQNPNQLIEALTTAAYVLARSTPASSMPISDAAKAIRAVSTSLS